LIKQLLSKAEISGKYAVGCSIDVNHRNGFTEIKPYFSYPKGLNHTKLFEKLNKSYQNFCAEQNISINDLYENSKMFLLTDIHLQDIELFALQE
jgi:hypothetical protein